MESSYRQGRDLLRLCVVGTYRGRYIHNGGPATTTSSSGLGATTSDVSDKNSDAKNYILFTIILRMDIPATPASIISHSTKWSVCAGRYTVICGSATAFILSDI